MEKIFILTILFSCLLRAQENNFPVDTSFTVYSAYEKEMKSFPFIEIVVPKLPEKVTLKENIVYRSVGQRKLHLDLFEPTNNNKEPLPVVMLIFGGGWRSGNKIMEHPMAIKLAANGYVAAAVEYRLSPEAKYPAGVYDLKAAVRWLKNNSAKFNIDTNRIAVLGESAGGTLAALIGVSGTIQNFEEAGISEKTSSKVHAIVDIDGILDFTNPAESGKDTVPAKPSAGKLWFGASYKENPMVWIEASPLTYAGEGTPPIIFINSSLERFHAGRDQFINKIKPFNIYYEIHTIPDTPHPFWLFHPWFDKTSDYVLDFLNKIFRG